MTDSGVARIASCATLPALTWKKRVYTEVNQAPHGGPGTDRENGYMESTVLIVEDSDTTADTLEIALLSCRM